MKNSELIDKFFTDSLSSEDQILFNRLLQDDEEFREEFLFQQDLKKALQANKREALKATVSGFEEEYRHKKNNGLRSFWLIAASVVILLGLGALVVKIMNDHSPENLYAEYFVPYRNIVEPVERGGEANNLEAKAFQAYENGRYYKAINLFNSLENSEKNYIKFYKAISLMQVNKTDQAIELLLPLSTLKKEGKYGCSEKANWYLALAYLKKGNIDKARSQLMMIEKNPEMTFKKKEAAEILEVLD